MLAGNLRECGIPSDRARAGGFSLTLTVKNASRVSGAAVCGMIQGVYIGTVGRRMRGKGSDANFRVCGKEVLLEQGRTGTGPSAVVRIGKIALFEAQVGCRSI